jgi:hypothetical protein
MRILILDDNSERHKIFKQFYLGHKVTHVYYYSDCIQELKKGGWDIVHLDHDLGEEVNDADTLVDSWGSQRLLTGLDVVRWMIDYPVKNLAKKVIVHSVNPVGGQKMQEELVQSGFDSILRPFNDYYGELDV